jgi:hypothetical protein
MSSKKYDDMTSEEQKEHDEKERQREKEEQAGRLLVFTCDTRG